MFSLQTIMSADIPLSINVFTECCVGFVFNSPEAERKELMLNE